MKKNNRPFDEQFTEVANTHTDEQENLTYIDVYESEDDNVPGRTVAVVDRDSLKVIFFDNGLRRQAQVVAAIDEVIREIQDERALVALKATSVTLLEAFKAVDKAWDAFNPNYEFQDSYPFEDSFPIVMEKIEAWVKEISEIN